MKADNKKIWIRGQFVEVTDEVYAAYMKGDRKIRYFENDLKTGRTVKDKDGNIKQTLPSREDSLDRLMENTLFVTAEIVAKDLGVSKPFAYKLVRQMNDELNAKGYLTVAGRVSRKYYEERFYGLKEG